MTKERIDKLIVERGLAESLTRAQAIIMAGVVLADERRVEKASEMVAIATVIRIKGESAESRYASRAGLKLEAALRHFEIEVTGLGCIDVGSSTGGFTDCLLEHGARHVTAIDSGTNQLIWRLRQDARVEVRENTNARHLSADDFPALFDLAVMDVSFISVTKIIPAVLPLLTLDGRLIILIKPQFEVGRGEVGKGGIVRDPLLHERVVGTITRFVTDLGPVPVGVIESPILGGDGNKEFLALFEMREAGREARPTLVEHVDYYFENGLMVLTGDFLLKRGYCCENRCRHCPYS